MTDLGPDYIRAKSKKGGAAVILHKRDLTDDYIAEPLTAKEADAVANAGAGPVLDASVKAHEEASIMADNERAALAKQAADARAAYEAASLAKRDAAAQAAVDQKEIAAAAAEAAVKVTEKKAADAKKAPGSK